MKGFFFRLKEMWVIFGITLILLIIVEIAFRIYFHFNPVSDPRTKADCYQNAEWVEEYYSELASCNTSEWKSYVYWQRNPFEGEFIHIDDQGYRQTIVNPFPFDQKKTTHKLFFFGGSTMWGSGVRDKFTIPSLVGNELSKRQFSVEIINYGESGYVSTQELIKLNLELKRGNIPDVVIFYDGANDIFSSLQSGIAGIPQNENNRKKEFNAIQEKKKSFLVFVQSFSTLATVNFIKQKFGANELSFDNNDEVNLRALAKETVHLYNENIRLVNALAKEFGFQALFYWQPTLFSKPELSSYEKKQYENALAIKQFAGLVNEELFQENLQFENILFRNLTPIFNFQDTPVYIDWCHVGENGNILISQEIINDLVPVLDSISNYKPNLQDD